MNDFRTYSAAFHAKNDDILHFGILGMKWGVRRYQNSDGTLTPAGKRRYNELNAKADYYKQKADNKYHEIFVEGKDSIARAISADAAETKSKILRKKARKYGTMTPEEKIALEEKKEQAAKEAKIQARTAKEYFQKHGKDLFVEQDARSDPKRAKAAADLGLEALNKIGRNGYDKETGITNDDRDWFIWEDQTIGYATVADMVLHGKTKSEIKDLINAAKNLDYSDVYGGSGGHDGYMKGSFQLMEGHIPDDYLDALFAILNAEGKLKHSAIRKKKKKSSK